MFKTPSLRNVALRKAFLYNGAFGCIEALTRCLITTLSAMRSRNASTHGTSVERLANLMTCRRSIASMTAEPPAAAPR